VVSWTIEINALATLQAGRPNVTALLYPLQIISTSIAGLPDQTSLLQGLGALYLAGENFPSIDPVYNAILGNYTCHVHLFGCFS
jgi:hypothetical protein